MQGHYESAYHLLFVHDEYIRISKDEIQPFQLNLLNNFHTYM